MMKVLHKDEGVRLGSRFITHRHVHQCARVLYARARVKSAGYDAEIQLFIVTFLSRRRVSLDL